MADQRYLKKSLRDFKCYDAAPVKERILLHANENPYNPVEDLFFQEEFIKILKELSFNRYPDPGANKLRAALGRLSGVEANRVIVGNGADEIIDFIITVFVEAGDVVITHVPSFEMYTLATQLREGIVIGVNDKDYVVDIDGIIEAANTNRAKLIFLCVPCNPTGYLLSEDDILRVIEETDSLVIVDEAYIEFTGVNYDRLLEYDRVIVLRTLSKAYGFAGLRVGYAVSTPELISQIGFAKPPYNLNELSQRLATFLVDNADRFKSVIEEIIEGRDALFEELSKLDGIKVYPSKTNFLLVKADAEIAPKLDEALLKNGIKVRSYGNRPNLENAFRITVGSKEDNMSVFSTFKEVIS